MMLARSSAVSVRPTRAAQRAVVAKAFSFPKLPFGGRNDDEEEEYEAPKAAPFSLSLPFGRSEEAAPAKTVKRAAPKPAARKTVAKTVSAPQPRKKSYTYEGSGVNPLVNNPFSTVERDRPVGSPFRPSEDIDLEKPKPSFWENWGRSA